MTKRPRETLLSVLMLSRWLISADECGDESLRLLSRRADGQDQRAAISNLDFLGRTILSITARLIERWL